MDLKKHLDRAEDALQRGQPDFALELCDQVLDFAPGEARAAGLFARACLALGGKGLLGRLGAGAGGLAARLSRLTRNAEGEARARRRAFLKDPGSAAQGILWAEALERAGHTEAALGVLGALADQDGEAARRAGALAAELGQVEEAIEYYGKALEANPRDTEAIRARKNLAAERALRTKRYDEAGSAMDVALDQEAFLRAARGLEAAPEAGDGNGEEAGEPEEDPS